MGYFRIENGVITPSILPVTDGATAISIKNAAGTTSLVNFDTSSTMVLLPYNSTLDYRVLATETVNRTIYVQGTSGDDVTGDGSVGLPYKTIIRAVKSIAPRINTGVAITIQIDEAGAYTETALFAELGRIHNSGILAINSDSTIRYGAAVVHDTFTAETHFTKTLAGAGWVAHAYRGYVVEDVSSGLFYPIGDNTTDTLYIGGNITFGTITIGEFNIKPYGVSITCSGNIMLPVGMLNFEGVSISSALRTSYIATDTLTISYCHVAGSYFYNRCISMLGSSIYVSTDTVGTAVGSLGYSVVSCDITVSVDGYVLESFFTSRTAGAKAVPALTANNSMVFLPGNLRAYYCGCNDFKYFLGPNATEYLAPETITIGGEYEWGSNVDFMIYGFKGLVIKEDPTSPIVDLHPSDLGVGLFTINGTTEAAHYISENDGYNAAILSTLKPCVNRCYAENLDIDTGTETVDSFADTVNATGVSWHYYISDSTATNIRTGHVDAVWNATTDGVNCIEYGQVEIGDTSGATLDVDINANNVRLRMTVGTDNWICKVNKTFI